MDCVSSVISWELGAAVGRAGRYRLIIIIYTLFRGLTVFFLVASIFLEADVFLEASIFLEIAGKLVKLARPCLRLTIV
jgi:hypothetical protein